jgi:hypothetical protein
MVQAIFSRLIVVIAITFGVSSGINLFAQAPNPSPEANSFNERLCQLLRRMDPPQPCPSKTPDTRPPLDTRPSHWPACSCNTSVPELFLIDPSSGNCFSAACKNPCNEGSSNADDYHYCDNKVDPSLDGCVTVKKADPSNCAPPPPPTEPPPCIGPDGRESPAGNHDVILDGTNYCLFCPAGGLAEVHEGLCPPNPTKSPPPQNGDQPPPATGPAPGNPAPPDGPAGLKNKGGILK